MRKFNVTGLCVPEEDYMVDVSGRVAQIISLIDDRSYFTINRARQYGKTTLLVALKRTLTGKYTVISTSFEGLGDSSFASEEAFCRDFLTIVSEALNASPSGSDYAKKWKNDGVSTFIQLGMHITDMCKDRKVVLIIDEVDKTSNSRIFLHFLSMLRSKFLARKSGDDYTFHSVILAGVYDIKNIKLKMIQEGTHTPHETEGNIYNSPWNIAMHFDIDMSFSAGDIAGMLNSYENDAHTGMDIKEISDDIYDFTGGYPYLVSRVCQCIDKELNKDWTKNGVQGAVMIIVQEKNVLFDDLAKNLENNKELYEFMYSLLIVGDRKSFVTDVPVMELGSTFGYIVKSNGNASPGQSGYAVISNKIFGMRMSNYFIAKDENASRMDNAVCDGLYRDIFRDGNLNMELCLQRFAEHYTEMFNERDVSFLERHGRLLFLSFLKPLINGQGFYHIESQFTDLRRMDIVVDYGRKQFIVELKIWRGGKYQEEAYAQLAEYLGSKNAAEGYLLTFDFRKERNKSHSAEWREVYGKRVFEVIV